MRVFIVVAICLALSLATSIAWGAHYLSGWDPVQLALGAEHYDLALQQPHPPGYVWYVLLVRGAKSFLGLCRGMEVLNALFEAGTAALITYLSLELGAPPWISVLGAVLWLLSPLATFYRCVEENYASGASLAMAIAALASAVARRGSAWTALGAGLLAGIGGGFRIEVVPFSIPVTLYALGRCGWRRIAVAAWIAGLVAGLATWLCVQSYYAGGFWQWLHLTQAQLGSTAGRTVGIKLARIVRVAALVSSGSPLNVLTAAPLSALALAAIREARRRGVAELLLRKRPEWIILATTFALYASLPALIHLGKYGYVLPATAALTPLATASLSRWPRRAAAALLLCGASLNVCGWLFAPPAYEVHKLPALERMALYSIGSPTSLPQVRELDSSLRKFLDRIHALCGSRSCALVWVTGPRSLVGRVFGVGWRRGMFYDRSALCLDIVIERGYLEVLRGAGGETLKPIRIALRGSQSLSSAILSALRSLGLERYRMYLVVSESLAHELGLRCVTKILNECICPAKLGELSKALTELETHLQHPRAGEWGRCLRTSRM